VYDARANEHDDKCYPDTRVNLLGQIQTWADNPSGECIFWLNGAAGTGKSTIARTVASRFNEQGGPSASFFFKRRDGDRGNANLFFTTIADQLVSKEPMMLQSVKEAIDSERGIAKKTLKVQFEKLILQPLGQIQYGSEGRPTIAKVVQEAINSDPDIDAKTLRERFLNILGQFHRGSKVCPTITMVVDALDECDSEKDIELIIRLLSQTKFLPFVYFKVFITSRSGDQIGLSFQKLNGKYRHEPLHKRPEIEQDISVFLKDKLAKIRDDHNRRQFVELKLPLDWPQKHIVQTLARMAIPLFIFAATVCRFVRNHPDPDRQLRHVLAYQGRSDSELDILDSTYLPVLDQLIADNAESQKSDLISDFRGLVGPIVLLAEPLSALSLLHLLGTPAILITDKLGRLRFVLNRLHAVLDVPPESDTPITPFHLSFRDFLVDPAKRDTKFWIDERETHQKLATNCIENLESCLKKNICNLKWPGIARNEVDARVEAFLPAHIQYACRYWVSHLEQSNERIRDRDQVHEFLKHHFLHWLEVLCLMGKISDVIATVTTLQTLIEVGDMEKNHG